MEYLELDRKLTIEEYRQLERKTDQKYEYHDGRVFALAGGTLDHSYISRDVFRALDRDLSDGPCEPYDSQFKLRVGRTNSYMYPDMMVICGEEKTSDEDPEALTNPILIIEVLSKSTAEYDRTKKFFRYRQIPSLQEYLLIDQYEPQADLYSFEGGRWIYSSFYGLEAVVFIPALSVELSLREIYRKVTFSNDR